jgi:hypothetical protein
VVDIQARARVGFGHVSDGKKISPQRAQSAQRRKAKRGEKDNAEAQSSLRLAE